LFYASLAFFLANCWILGIIIGDLDHRESSRKAENNRGT
jgi:hypothetical protein